jgi:hypothetical protein
MKRFLFIILALLCPVLSLAHPGKTDYQDGHKCMKNCEEWGLYYAEYHLHDKDRNPIRIAADRKPAVRFSPTAADPSRNSAPVSLPDPSLATTKPVTEAGRPVSKTAQIPESGMPLQEEAMFRVVDILLLIVAGLLLISLIMLRRKKERA